MSTCASELSCAANTMSTQGYACHSHIPQLFKTWAERPRRGGPDFFLIELWLLADVLSIVGLVVQGGLLTQQLQMAWYLMGDLAMGSQLMYYKGERSAEYPFPLY